MLRTRTRPKRATRGDSKLHPTPTQRYEVEVAEGLEALARDELARRLAPGIRMRETHISRRAPSSIGFDYTGDAADLLRLRTVDALCADLPFGHAIGSHEENARLYPQIIAEAARVARTGA